MAAGKETEQQGLPRGRHGLPRELVVENQRARLVSSMIETVAERGYGRTTVADVIGAAKISRRTFYESFANKEDCYAAAYEASFGYLRTMAGGGAEGAAWPASVREGLAALLETLAAHPDLAAFFLVSPAGVGDEIADRHHRAINELVEVLLAAAPKVREPKGAASIRAEALAGGFSRLAAMRVNAGRTAELPALLPDLVELFLRPYVGSEEAIRLARSG
jgi:AcrR family transcriptional regulator